MITLMVKKNGDTPTVIELPLLDDLPDLKGDPP